MRLNRNEFIMAFAFTLDFLEMEFRENADGHNKRTGLIAAWIGRAMGLCDEDVFDLSAYAMLHDNGITHACYNAVAEDGETQLDCTASHCVIGERNLAAFPFLRPRENMIKYHHEAFDGSGPFGISGEDIPLFSQIIALAEPLEAAYASGESAESITAHVMAEAGRRYAPELVEAFAGVAGRVSFWLSLERRFLDSEIGRHIPSYTIDIDLAQVLPMSHVMSGIIDSKSPFTGSHSKGLTEKTAVMCDYYGFNREKKTRMMIASDLHDIGKLAIPNRIIDKAGKLTEPEFDQMKTHAFYTRKVIESVQGFEDIAEWASNHHEKLDGSGYPFGRTAEAICFESQLIGCLDIYQALTEKRPYRESLSHGAACAILEGMAKENKINREITADIKKVLG
ncbi:HD domain-containing protein [Oscillospiraceae bacterium OttesenSCG-928-F05]|nr:HD domain-containing protein [Oscillospiraceae bacterium OttesenSCG-928-F05]